MYIEAKKLNYLQYFHNLAKTSKKAKQPKEKFALTISQRNKAEKLNNGCLKKYNPIVVYTKIPKRK